MQRNIIQTADGSVTIHVPALNEHYHSVNGAVTESLHVYIKNGLRMIEKSTLHILEMGFGTGLNAFLSWRENLDLKKRIVYTAIEKYPLTSDEISRLNYATEARKYEVFIRMHECDWEKNIEIDNGFVLKKISGDIRQCKIESGFDVVYYDAFAPDIQPELWTLEVFEKIYCAMKTGGVLATYSSKGSVRRTLEQAGFKVEKVPGPPGKREMIVARKNLKKQV